MRRIGTFAVGVAAALTLWACGNGDVLFSPGNGSVASSSNATTATTSSGNAGGSNTVGTTTATTSSSGSGGAAASSSSGNGGSHPGVGAPCTFDGAGCPEPLFCQAPGCGSGTCQEKLPVANQTGEQAPQCGCDNINYWNGSVASSLGMPIQSEGRCTQEKVVKCTPTTCGPGRFCSLDAGDGLCAIADPEGICWGLPQTCDPDATDKERQCAGPCLDICSLIKAEKKWKNELVCF